MTSPKDPAAGSTRVGDAAPEGAGVPKGAAQKRAAPRPEEVREAGSVPYQSQSSQGSIPQTGAGGQAPTPDTAAAIEYLRWLRPAGPWLLAAIADGKRPPVVRTFAAADVDAIARWLAEQNGQRRANVYYAPNPTRAAMAKKPAATDIASLSWVHVDIDPQPDRPLADEQARILAALRRHDGLPEPSAIVFSGGGYQALWRLAEPLALDGSQVAADRAKLHNLQAEYALGADRCHNVDRILRLPGTINWPNAKKQERGQVPTLARVVVRSDAAYPLAAFPPAQAIGSSAAAADAAPASRGRTAKTKSTRGAAAVVDFGPAPTGRVDLPQALLGTAAGVLVVRGCEVDVLRELVGDGTLGHRPEHRIRDWIATESRNEAQHYATCAMIRAGMAPAAVLAVLGDGEYGISRAIRHASDGKQRARWQQYAQRQVQRAAAEVAAAREAEAAAAAVPFVFRGGWAEAAAAFSASRFPELLHTNGDFHGYRGPHYEAIEDATIESEAWKFLAGCLREKPGKGGMPSELVPLLPTPEHVAALTKATRAFAHRPVDTYSPPCWIRREPGDPEPADLIAVRNGLLRVSTGELLPATPRYFTPNRVEVNYTPGATCPTWLAKLDEVFDGDERVALLQEVMGYLLVPDTSQQKAFLLIGPPRSFKGTTTRVVKRLVGDRNFAPLNANHLRGSTFALQPLIGRTVAAIPDLRLGMGADPALVQALLNITGEDDVTIDRKNKPHWTGKLSCRVLAASNELPTFKENSAALANRFVVVEYRKSYLGAEDHDLDGKLAAESAGILLWALEGLRRLRARGRFDLPESARAAVREMHEAGNPVVAFVRECCVVGAEQSVPGAALYRAFRAWCAEQGYERIPANQWFGRMLRTAYPAVVFGQKVPDGPRRAEGVRGIGLRAVPVADDYGEPF